MAVFGGIETQAFNVLVLDHHETRLFLRIFPQVVVIDGKGQISPPPFQKTAAIPELDFRLFHHGVLLSPGGLLRLAAVGGLVGCPVPLAPALQRCLHPALSQFRAVLQALVRQAGPVLPPDHFLIDHMDRDARGFGKFFRRPTILPQFFNFLAVLQGPKSIIGHFLTPKR